MTTGTHVDNEALFAVLSSLADNKQAIGRRYAYWCNGAPALEAAVAAAAMTQDELGHARTLYPLLEDFVQAQAVPEQIKPTTRTLHYHLCALDQDFTGWCDFVATNFLVDTALTTFFEAAQNSTYEPLGTRARKIIQEEQLHFVHAEGWVRRLNGPGGGVRRALQTSLARFWEEALCWFGPPDDATIQALLRNGIINASPDELRARYLSKIMPILNELELEVPIPLGPQGQPSQSLPWTRWNRTTRRLEPT
ncbi:Phenylacetic acid catabolic protein [Ktedonospora formicarum]|uniref:Phenylacetate-CoA oxygenase subunit PaaI n=1 Tax=Ktedonospora formicarum TaxID=2778364 RepID=A0A8J3HRK6_9CHLR|nr:Phenylacetic acid catabolic protein [Ktedonospora formicarum]GHO42329.1 phenylacetate-CoA oxygenase subunit PaaI [Ktedonospora formicarum]